MRYSLRSLMTFSIRDLFWVTVVVALAVGWAGDRSKLSKLEADVLGLSHVVYSGVFGRRPTDAEALDYARKFLPNTSAPAPNPPRP